MHGLRAALVAGLLASLVGGPLHAAERDQTAEIMAAYVYNFARFVEWPAAALFPQGRTLQLCTPVENALEGHLLRVHGREAQGRSVALRVVAVDDDLTSCQILFLPKQQAAHSVAWLTTLSRKPVLTISDAPGFTAGGGMIGLYIAAGRVRFSVNRDAADSSGLRIGSRLLSLAQDAPGGSR